MTAQKRRLAAKRERGECFACTRPNDGETALCADHREANRVRNSIAYHSRREEVRIERAAARYGVTVESIRDLIDRHSGLCGLCGQPETVRGNGGRIKALSIDHDHETGKIRGLLCNNCNRAIGLLKDDASLLARAVDWVNRGKLVSN